MLVRVRCFLGLAFLLGLQSVFAQTPDVGRLMLLAFDENVASPETLLNSYQVAGFLFYVDDIKSSASSKAMIAKLQAQSPYPLLFGIDQEGGPFNSYRVDNATRFPGAMMLAATRNLELAQEVGFATGQELAYLGINMNFAPVADVNSNPDNPIIGIRSFGDDPELVSEFALAYAQGLEKAGVAAVAKHFPGHGNTQIDSHLGLPRVSSSLETLNELDLKPFKALLGLSAFMSAHIVFEALDPDLPATLSPSILTGLLRNELGFKGVIITDYLDMQALTQSYSLGEAAVKAIEAGADLLLVSSDPKQQADIYQALQEALLTGRLSQARLDESIKRISTLAQSYKTRASTAPLPDYAAHQKLALELARQGTTLVHTDATLPLDPQAKLLVISPTITDFGQESDLASVLAKNGLANTAFSVAIDPSEPEQNQAIALAQKADLIVLGIYYWQGSFPTRVQSLYARLKQLDKPIIVVALGNPDSERYLEAPPNAFIASYGFRESNLAALADILTGAQQAYGRLPVSLSTP
jgi:beta-N-acetylhexosaminidase